MVMASPKIQQMADPIVSGQTFVHIFNADTTDDIGENSFDGYETGRDEVTLSMRKRGRSVNIIQDHSLIVGNHAAVLELSSEDTELLREYTKNSGILYEPFVCDIRAVIDGRHTYFGPYEFQVRQEITGLNRIDDAIRPQEVLLDELYADVQRLRTDIESRLLPEPFGNDLQALMINGVVPDWRSIYTAVKNIIRPGNEHVGIEADDDNEQIRISSLASTAGVVRELTVPPTGTPPRTVVLPVDYREYEIIFLNWSDGNTDVELSFSTDLLPVTGERVYKSEGLGRVTWNAEARSFRLTAGVSGDDGFRPAELYDIGTTRAASVVPITQLDIDIHFGFASSRAPLVSELSENAYTHNVVDITDSTTAAGQYFVIMMPVARHIAILRNPLGVNVIRFLQGRHRDTGRGDVQALFTRSPCSPAHVPLQPDNRLGGCNA